jgi:putative membrane protein
MSLLAQVLALIAAAIHVLFFVMESIVFSQPKVWRRFGLKSQADADVVRPMALNQGFYNLFLALGVFVGVALTYTGAVTSGVAAVVFGCVCMVLAALVLVTSNRRFFTASLVQGALPLLALLLIAF